MKIKLTLEIDYDISEMERNGMDDEDARDELESVLTDSLDRLVGDGGLSGETLATVNTWDAVFSDEYGYMRIGTKVGGTYDGSR